MVPAALRWRSVVGSLVAAGRRRLSTVFALSSGHGRCGVAVIRVTGPASADALRALTGGRSLPAARRAVVRRLFSPCDGALLDRALLLWLPGPASFTGEDCCELHTHGGPAVVAAVLRALAAVPGLQPAKPGEFTRRAFHAGKLDVTQVEGLADLLAAETEQQRRQAVRQAEGHLRRQYGRWRAALLRCLATAEAFIDFGEEELIEEDAMAETVAAADRLADDMQRHLADGRRGERLRSGVQVTIAGAPNAGKSSLLNSLVQREAAIVSEAPGTTRDLLDATLDVAGFPVVLTDTAGLRDASDAVEREGVRRARGSAAAADLVLLVAEAPRVLSWLDGPGGAPTADVFVSEQLSALGLSAGTESPTPETQLVLNKVDLVTEAEAERLGDWCRSGSGRAALVSCLTGHGVPALVEVLGDSLGRLCADAAAPAPALTRQRHRLHVAGAERHVRQFIAQVAAGGDLALAAEQLRLAARQIGELTGHVGAEEILDVIFSDFCIGK
ncbi:tRNA modification GTPase GTPBP3, mitochondrial [Amphibalanus amphitrite]|uniref:tRNA modification GTPase GTPBP3, mitochondrial n=1 Tax=Amphibalanus amphitrite TaxID=1232801 RepID=A0A6A4X5J5_AMPAM|nr:tRNA modification GTPase GTPBP3, mitochondrial [Amphibalanus amphitrite]KAF0311285.1 tRNA modification GTPase GTPBP3, mitochondrial [Amphibalanus amphitrite]